jgi:hypothetical protein
MRVVKCCLIAKLEFNDSLTEQGDNRFWSKTATSAARFTLIAPIELLIFDSNWEKIMGRRAWTDEQKTKQSALIHSWQPWKKSTGAKTPEGKTISSMNAHSGYFRRRARFARWLLRVKHHNLRVTPELINELKRRADKLNLFTDTELDEYIQHSQNFDDIAMVNVIAAAEQPCKKIIDHYLTQLVIQAAAKTIR